MGHVGDACLPLLKLGDQPRRGSGPIQAFDTKVNNRCRGTGQRTAA